MNMMVTLIVGSQIIKVSLCSNWNYHKLYPKNQSLLSSLDTELNPWICGQQQK